jgi:hypothetical protein
MQLVTLTAPLDWAGSTISEGAVIALPWKMAERLINNKRAILFNNSFNHSPEVLKNEPAISVQGTPILTRRENY